jgi:hypothetical protein
VPQQRIEYGGVIHEFPDDFTDDDIRLSLEEWDAKMPDPQAKGYKLYRAGQRPTTRNLPMLAGLFAAPLTGGMSLAGQMAIPGAAAGATALASGAYEGDTASQTGSSTAREMFLSALPPVAGGAMRAIAGRLRPIAKAVSSHVTGIGDPSMVDEILGSGRGTLTPKHLWELKQEVPDVPKAPARTGLVDPSGRPAVSKKQINAERRVGRIQKKADRKGDIATEYERGLNRARHSRTPVREAVAGTIIGGATKSPALGAASAGAAALTRPLPLSRISQALYDAAPKLARMSQTAPELLRGLLMSIPRPQER